MESVRRSLFGPVDRDQLRAELKLRLQQICEQDSRRWNFNFQAETPLPGRLQWEEIPAGCAASFYREPTPPSASKSEDDERLSGRDQENCSRISNAKCAAAATPVRRKRTLPKARITDYFAKRRRTTDTKSILNHLLSSSSDAAQCKTIR
ncbi:cyclin-dependent kinase inhibitor 1Ca isoform X2 [Betta splendens]|nr:cyclin-dependent kinase inhibitor 1Ca isoform X2 [Betta splendens]